MKFWHQYPFVRLIIPFIAGIFAAIVIDLPMFIPFWILIGILIVLIFQVFIFSKRISYKFRWITGLAVNTLLILFGFEITVMNTPKFENQNISKVADKSNVFIIQVSEPVSEKPNSYKVIAKALQFKDSLCRRKTTGKLILYFEKDSLVRKIGYGEILIIQSYLNEVSAPQNPGEFNYKKYLSNRGIYNQGFVKSGEWQVIDKNTANPLKALGINLRTKFLKILEENNIKGKEFAVVSAILLGYDDKLDSEQLREFTGAGAMHILCVSGLHVGIIYLILNSLLSFLNKKRWTRFIKVVLLLLLIWVYALITGFSPSVLRASTMFSFIIVGRTMKRKANIYNILAASAFLLLVINPYILTEVGFQLSYIAVIGIVMMYKPVYNLFIPDNWLLRKIWQMTVVSIAATFATFPLSLFYFHQFPSLFLVTNLIAIPSSMLIIYAGILVLLTSPVPLVSVFFAKILSGIIWFLNFSVSSIEGLPFSTIRGISIHSVEMILIFGLTISLMLLFIQKRKSFLFYAFACLIILMFFFSYKSFKNQNRRRIVVYSINKASAIDLIDGKEDFFLTDSLLINDIDKIAYHIQNNRWKSGIKNVVKFHVDNKQIIKQNFYKNKNFIQFYDKRLVIINPEFRFYPTQNKMKVDYLVVSQNPDIKIAELTESFDFEQLIFDSSNRYWKINKWIEECSKTSVEYYDVKRQGAWDKAI